MLKHYLTPQNAYTFLMCFLAFGMPNLNLLMSLGVILLFITWLISPGIKEGFRAFKKNVPAVLMAGLFLIHVIWLFNTSDFDYAFKDLRSKLPLIVLALVLGSIPISRKQVKLIFLALSLGVWLACISGYVRYAYLPEGIYDYRQIVQGVSHIRLSLLMVTLVMAVLYFWKELSLGWKLCGLAVIINTLVFFNIAQLATGFIILVVTLGFALLYRTIQKANLVVTLSTVLLLIIAVGAGIYYSVNYYNHYFVATADIPSDTERTALGNPYKEPVQNDLIENGTRNFDYYCETEMVDAWNVRSEVPMSLESEDLNLNYTLIRYLSSKGLRKDYDGVMSLSDKDIENVENGFPSEIYVNDKGLKLRFHAFMFGLHMYDMTGRVTGSSFFQRVLYWKVAGNIIERNWLLGVGTGDIKDAIYQMHQEMHPEVNERFWLRAHNQFLSFFAAFGIVGFVYFLYMFGYAMIKRRRNFLALSFLIIAFVSCLTEDTLETQAGVTFFAFFYALFSQPFRESDN